MWSLWIHRLVFEPKEKKYGCVPNCQLAAVSQMGLKEPHLTLTSHCTQSGLMKVLDRLLQASQLRFFIQAYGHSIASMFLCAGYRDRWDGMASFKKENFFVKITMYGEWKFLFSSFFGLQSAYENFGQENFVEKLNENFEEEMRSLVEKCSTILITI